MLDYIKKGMYMGMGLAYLTKEKLGELATELSKVGQLSEKEGKELFEEMNRRADDARKKVREEIDESVKDAMQKMHLAVKEDLEKLESRMGALEKRMDKISKLCKSRTATHPDSE